MSPHDLVPQNRESVKLAGRKVCVIGAGTMGCGIAIHLLNLGFDVSLLDSTTQHAIEGLERARQFRPPHFLKPERASEIQVGNTLDDKFRMEESDWIIEAIYENVEAKMALFREIDEIVSNDAFVTTNTSGLEISRLAEGLSDRFRERFLGAHFFNPPRYLKLLELVPTEHSDPGFVAEFKDFLETQVGRRVVIAKDTPGFIANRYGMWSMFHAVHVAERLHLTVEEVDAITGPFLGRPTSASFRLNDMVGLDVMRDIASNLLLRRADDPAIKTLELPGSMLGLLARGWIGQKALRGYYQKQGNELLVLDFNTFAYRQKREVRFESMEKLSKLPLGLRIKEALQLKDEVGEFLRMYLPPTLAYAEQIRDEVCHSAIDFDHVMQWGFGWEQGPFELIDAIGTETLGLPERIYYKDDRALAGSEYIPVPEDRRFRSIEQYPVLVQGTHARIRDLGDGISALCICTRNGVLSPELIDELIALITDFKCDRFVFTSEAKVFSFGFDLKSFHTAILEDRFTDIDLMLQRLHYLGDLLQSRVSVAAIYGYALGGGFELALSCSTIVANSETKIGLPEAKVGLIPAGRGTSLMRLYNQSSPQRIAELAEMLTTGMTSLNAEHARTLGYLRPTDSTCFHPDGLIETAKRVAQATTRSELPEWKSYEGLILGMVDLALEKAKSKGELSDHDLLIGHKLKGILARSSNFDDACTRERTEFLDLCLRALSQARLKHMIDSNRPLRN